MTRYLNLKTLLPVTIVTLISVVIYVYTSSIPKEVIVNLVNQFGLLGVIAFILVNLITYIVAPMSNTPFLIAGYLMFGEQVVIYLSIAMALSTATNYWIARIWGRKVVKRLAGEEGMKKVDEVIHQFDSIALFLIIRFFQGAMHKFVSYAFGLESMNFKIYLIFSLIALIPYSLFWYYLVGFVTEPVGFLLLSTILGSTLPLLVSLFLLINAKFKILK